MFAPIIFMEGQIIQYLEEYHDDRCCLLEILRFLGKHPFTRFSRLAIIHAFKNQGVLVNRGLKYLVEKGLVTEEIDNDIHLFSLTATEQTRKSILELGRLDWYQWQSLLKQISTTLY